MSVFTMDDVHQVMSIQSLDKGKAYAKDILSNAENIKDKTRSNALLMISKARSNTQLGMTMSNWILAHPSEGLKTI